MKIRELKKQLMVGIPAHLIAKLGWQKGDDLTIEYNTDKHGITVYHFHRYMKHKEKQE